MIRLKECIRERHRIDFAHPPILEERWVNVEEDRHVYRFSREEPLLVKAEALDLIKVLPGLQRRHVVRCNPDDRLARMVRRLLAEEGAK